MAKESQEEQDKRVQEEMQEERTRIRKILEEQTPTVDIEKLLRQEVYRDYVRVKAELAEEKAKVAKLQKRKAVLLQASDLDDQEADYLWDKIEQHEKAIREAVDYIDGLADSEHESDTVTISKELLRGVTAKLKAIMKE